MLQEAAYAAKTETSPMIDRRPLPARSTPRGVFGALIRCECGHGIGAHTSSGCSVGVYAACACRLADGAALARAIERASWTKA